MKIERNKWVDIHYTLTDDDGTLIDSSVGKDPLGYIHGNGYLIPGLERELEGKEAGAKFTAVIQPKDGYGEINESMKINVPRENFDVNEELEIGQQFQVMTTGGPAIVRIVGFDGDIVKIDGNHELAGKTLHFDVEVVNVRDATDEELNPPCSCGGSCGGNCGGNCGGEGGCGGNCSCGN